MSLFLSYLLISAALLISLHPEFAFGQENADGQFLQAQWISGFSQTGAPQSVLHFRKTLPLPNHPDHFLIRISADTMYILHVNGKYVGRGPDRGDLNHWFFETYNLAPYLKAGDNLIAATVWNFGHLEPLAQMSSGVTALIVEGVGKAQSTVSTGPSWQVEMEPGIHLSPTDPKEIHDYYAAPPPETLDAAAYDWDWDSPQNTSLNWVAASALGAGALRGVENQFNDWQLTPAILPAQEERPDTAGKVVRAEGVNAVPLSNLEPLSVPAFSNFDILLDHGTLTTAFPHLSFSGGKAASITLKYAEALYDNTGQKGNRNDVGDREIHGVSDRIIADGARDRTFTPIFWRAWRYLQISVQTADQPLTIYKIDATFTAYPFEEQGKFDSDMPELKRIWDVGWRTARLAAHDTYMDTPYWEQLQYIGDTRIQALISYTVAGDNRLARQAIDAFDNSRLPDGITLDRYPTSLFEAIPPFSLEYIGMIRDFALYNDDPAFVKSHLMGTRTVLEWFRHHENANGLVGRLPWGSFVDWSHDFSNGDPPQDNEGNSSILTLKLIGALRDAALLDKSYGDSRLADDYKKEADRLSVAVYSLCWNARSGLLADTPEQNHFSQHANILGILFDVIPKAQQQDVMLRVLSATEKSFPKSASLPAMSDASFYFRFFLARALDHVGMADKYIDLLDPWRKMLGLGLTTWAETTEPTRSDSHAWSAHPNFDLLTLVAGIAPQGLGFKAVSITPHLGELKHVSATLPHAKGLIVLAYDVEGNGAMRARITLPDGLPGTLSWKGITYPLHAGTQLLYLRSKQ